MAKLGSSNLNNITMYIPMNFSLSDSQITKLKNAKNNDSEVSIKLSQDLMSNDGAHELYLTQRQINKLKDGKPHIIDFSKTQVKSQKGGPLGSLLKYVIPVQKNVITPLAVGSAMSAAQAGMQKKILV